MSVIIILYYILSISFLLYYILKKKLTPTIIFILAQALFFTGMIRLLDFNNSDDFKIVLIYFIGLLFFVIGVIIGEQRFKYSRNKITFINKPLLYFQYTRIIIIIIISFFLFIYFCYETRLSTIKIMISNLLHNSNSDITDTRLASYLVPGTAYIYMFRIILLPAVVVAMLNKEYRFSKIIKISCVFFMILFSLITGQRGGFFMVMFMWGMTYMIRFLYINNNIESKKIVKKIIFISLIFIIFFSFMSVINGRVSESILEELNQRFFIDNQQSAYVCFHYIFDKGTSWGRNWYEELINFLVPGEKYTPLSKIAFSIMYSSTRGTAPPCLWGSVFYNFSWIGIIIFGFLYGLLTTYVGYRFYSKEINGIRCAIYSYMFVSLGTLVAGGPFQLLNNGFVPLLLLAYILHIDKNVKKTSLKYNLENK